MSMPRDRESHDIATPTSPCSGEAIESTRPVIGRHWGPSAASRKFNEKNTTGNEAVGRSAHCRASCPIADGCCLQPPATTASPRQRVSRDRNQPVLLGRSIFFLPSHFTRNSEKQQESPTSPVALFGTASPDPRVTFARKRYDT
jgi:hypothetical protein